MEMTDLELTKLAAEAVGIELLHINGILQQASESYFWLAKRNHANDLVSYDPHRKAHQAFELMEKLRIETEFNDGMGWFCGIYKDMVTHREVLASSEEHDDLKRAIVECAARYALWKRGQK